MYKFYFAKKLAITFSFPLLNMWRKLRILDIWQKALVYTEMSKGLEEPNIKKYYEISDH